MISKKEFKDFISEYTKFDKAIERIENAISGSKYGCNLFECDWYISTGKMLDIFLNSHFTEEGCDIINWWMFEDVDHIIYQTVDSDLFNGRTEIQHDVNNIEDLWNYLLKNKKELFKDV